MAQNYNPFEIRGLKSVRKITAKDDKYAPAHLCDRCGCARYTPCTCPVNGSYDRDKAGKPPENLQIRLKDYETLKKPGAFSGQNSLKLDGFTPPGSNKK